MNGMEVRTIVEIKERLKEIGCYDSNSFDAWFDMPIPHFDYESPRSLFENGDLATLSQVITWMANGSHGSSD